MYADGELSPRETRMLEQHAATCAACRTNIDALRGENAVLRDALRSAENTAPIPRFVPPPRARDFVVLVASVVLIGGFSQAFWSTIVGAIPSELSWLDPLKSRTLFERAVDVVTFIVYEGSAMWTAALNFIGAALVVAFVAWLAFSAARHRAFAGMAAAMLAVVVALPSPSHAFEIRHNHDADVTVAANEAIDDTLLAAGRTVTIDGTVNGDLLAFAGEVTVRGNVSGNLVTAAQTITVEGTIGGSVIGAAENLSFDNARVGRDLYGFGNSVEIAPTANVSGNAISFANTVDVGGRVGLDLKGFAETVNVSGAVEGDFDGYARRIAIAPTARVAGNVTGHVETAGDLTIADGAVVGGTVDEQISERERRANRYERPRYYFSQVIRLAGSFVTGLLLLWLFPVLREITLPNALAVLRSAGIGLAAAVTMPVAALLICFTIVGIPLAVLTFLVGAIGLYFSKAVVAQIIGRGVLRNRATPPHFAVTLLVGLAIVIVAVNLPWIGGLASLVLTLVGFGVIVSLILARLNRSSVV
jgi:cytoskeletal protein CcmA (bactofilin family)/anti-sigma factor RsiW